ncbi:hypothetical protein brsh051_16710 [Brooklawnia propionicigenes]|uniref:Uncharacterized protein n=1 Tax=Brooklawnia propionicigenes TaxID=3041175 RepID=A0AAN0KC10_9ACTN|nr:hypothetical protein brsh051_16710 [Brooklawnia sp. SH051]
MGTPQSQTPNHRRRRALESVGKLCTLVIGLPVLFAALQMNAPSELPVWVAGLVTLASGVIVSVLFTRRQQQAVSDADLQLERA